MFLENLSQAPKQTLTTLKSGDVRAVSPGPSDRSEGGPRVMAADTGPRVFKDMTAHIRPAQGVMDATAPEKSNIPPVHRELQPAGVNS